MAQDGQIITLDVDDAKLRQILTDPVGGPATFDEWLDVFGVNGFSLSPEYTEKELAGDATTIDQYSKLKKLTGSFNCQVTFATLEVLLGATAAYTGSSPNETATLVLSSSDLPNYFELDVRSSYRGGSDATGGDFHIRISKAKMTKFTYTMASEEYATLQIDWAGVARLADGYFMTMVENETAVTYTGSPDTTAPTLSTSTPADGATGVSGTANIVLNFSEEIVYDIGNYAIAKADGTAVAFTGSKTDADTVTLNPTPTLDSAGVYIVTVAGVRDLAGNMLASPAVINFTIA
jgi:methionine-rich copper-binding protein CopC